MRQRILLLTYIFSFTTLNASAQFEKNTQMLGISGYVGKTPSIYVPFHSLLVPSYQFFIKKNWSVGVLGYYSSSKLNETSYTRHIGIGVDSRYYFGNNRFKPFVFAELIFGKKNNVFSNYNVGLNYQYPNRPPYLNNPNTTYPFIKGSLGIGLSYKLTNKFSIELCIETANVILDRKYSSIQNSYKSIIDGAFLPTYMYDAVSTFNPKIGIKYTLGHKK